ncbi:uncharacterized protein LOC134265062, partial [Saccostrea cucullata]|uniref:uncharacterized protein LOC134265062 n=1 Tax=Saccostrea cuccullata TaxID=36930 RepID=UPI002ED2F26F
MTSYEWLDLGIQHLSESVFMRLSHLLGSPQTVDLRGMIINQVMKTREEDRIMTSGSYREGFRLEGSDKDEMFWPNDHTVIWDLDQVQKYDLSRKTLILCDCTESRPGFGLLELLTPTHREYLKNACMRINDRLYISSSKYRQITCSVVFPNSTEHGPCGSCVIGGTEYDAAHCFISDFWPPPASRWIDRCHTWPPSYIVDDIVRNGCHFVAIGHKLGKHADKEWRISFSLAEQKLVYSMNYCQFLTYGLLKLFLKESINNGLNSSFLTPTHREYLKNACMRINDRLYISSSKYRQITCSVVFPNSTEHGPCGSCVIGGTEYDAAHCFISDFWPPPASRWIDRCHTWPPSYIVDDIVRNGCHFVAIGHKLGKHADKEWRISFSLAEQKLVYSMNYCQFLTYGLLKLFLKESINNGLSDEDKLLCSYHMKTAVFWAIQQNTLPNWHPQNFLQCFWVCFKLILKWVYEGACPNFFIFENNMFLGKIHGEAQKHLFFRLHK